MRAHEDALCSLNIHHPIYVHRIGDRLSEPRYQTQGRHVDAAVGVGKCVVCNNPSSDVVSRRSAICLLLLCVECKYLRRTGCDGVDPCLALLR